MNQVHYHVFCVDPKQDINQQFAGAARCFADRWQQPPVVLCTRQATAVPDAADLTVIRDERIPPAHWYFIVEKEVRAGE